MTSYSCEDPRAPARGILLAVLISIPVWIAIGVAVWTVSR